MSLNGTNTTPLIQSKAFCPTTARLSLPFWDQNQALVFDNIVSLTVFQALQFLGCSFNSTCTRETIMISRSRHVALWTPPSTHLLGLNAADNSSNYQRIYISLINAPWKLPTLGSNLHFCRARTLAGYVSFLPSENLFWCSWLALAGCQDKWGDHTAPLTPKIQVHTDLMLSKTNL